jgi:hypothetical protein
MAGKRTLGRPRGRWVDNIKLDLGEMGWGGFDWIVLAQGRDKCKSGNEPLGSNNAGKFLRGCTSGSFSSSAQLHTVS